MSVGSWRPEIAARRLSRGSAQNRIDDMDAAGSKSASAGDPRSGGTGRFGSMNRSMTCRVRCWTTPGISGPAVGATTSTMSSFDEAGNGVMESGDNAVDARMPCFGDQSDSHGHQLGWAAGAIADTGSGSIPPRADRKGRHRAKGRMSRASIRSR